MSKAHRKDLDNTGPRELLVKQDIGKNRMDAGRQLSGGNN